MKKSVRNLMIATGVVALGGYVISQVLSSKKNRMIEDVKKDEEDVVLFREEQPRKYHTLCYIKKKNSTEE